MDQNNKTLIASITLEVYQQVINDKILFGYVVILPDGSELKPEYLYGTAKEAAAKANGRLYSWLKNRK